MRGGSGNWDRNVKFQLNNSRKKPPSETNNVYVIVILKVKVTANRRHTYTDHGLEDEQTASKEIWKGKYSGWSLHCISVWPVLIPTKLNCSLTKQVLITNTCIFLKERYVEICWIVLVTISSTNEVFFLKKKLSKWRSCHILMSLIITTK